MLLKNKYATACYKWNAILVHKLIDQCYLLFCGKFNKYFNGKASTLHERYFIFYILQYIKINYKISRKWLIFYDSKIFLYAKYA